MFGQLTVRFHSQQTLAVYDRYLIRLYSENTFVKNAIVKNATVKNAIVKVAIDKTPS